MELHRNRGDRCCRLVCVLAGTVLLTTGGGLLRTVTALGGVALGGAGLAATLRPFRFVIDADGLTVRRRGLRRQLRWAELALVVLDRPAAGVGGLRLLVVPVDGAVGLPSDARVDGRPATELLDLAHVRESPDEIAAALARHAGDRSVDAGAAPRRVRPGLPRQSARLQCRRGRHMVDTPGRRSIRGRPGAAAGGARRAGRGDGERPADRPAWL